MNKEIFDKKLQEKFSDENYTVLYYGKNSYENSVLKCLDCGRRIEVNTGELFRKRRKHICSACHYIRKDTLVNRNNISKLLTQKDCTEIEFYMSERKGIRHDCVRYKCGDCGRLNTREVANLLRAAVICNYCEVGGQLKDTDSFNEQLQERFGKTFDLLSEYVNAKTNVRIRCNHCGFIRDVKPNAFLQSGYCPKCSTKISKGEKIIREYLTKCNIEFETQKYFSDWNIGIHYFDFYIPEYNLLLEYHGIQHYEYNEFFHGTQENFLYRQAKDNTKKQTALTKGYNFVIISYQNFEKLEFILSYIFNSTTIPQGSRGKLLEIETSQEIG